MEKYSQQLGDELSLKPISVNSKKASKEYSSITSFKEISFETKFGEDNKCNSENLGKFYHGQLRIDHLINDIYSNENNTLFFFNFGNYASNHGFSLNNENPSMINTILKNASNSFSKSVKYNYITSEGIKKEAVLDIYMNLMPCHVDLSKAGFTFQINASSQEIEYRVNYIYTDYLNLRDFGKDEKDYYLENKYNAIIILTKNGEDFLAIVNENDKSYVKKRIIETFISELKKASTPQELKFLYESMPGFVQNVLLEYLDQELLWQHFLTVSFYKEGNLFSSDEKASGAAIIILRAFNNIKLIF